jgi:group I intron endonuclease
MEAGIYSITNTTNGYRYVGSAVNLNKRWNLHRHDLRHGVHGNGHLQHAFDKYGEDAFTFDVLEVCEIPALIPREQWWLDTAQPEYNICRIAGSPLGRACAEATHRKLSKAHKGIRHSPEACRHMSEAHKGRPNGWKGKRHTEETRRKQSLAHKGRPWSEARWAAQQTKSNERRNP